jgi:hypothetical protein
MPTVSAESLLSSFNPGLGNIVLHGVGTGLEAKLLAERFGRHRAVVVLETDPQHLALALRMWDLSAALRNRQILLLLAPDLAEAGRKLLGFCREHPAFDLPARMLAWPGLAKTQVNEFQSLIEDVGARLRPHRSRVFAEALAPLCQGQRAGTPGAIAVLTMVPGVQAGCLAGWLADGARAAGLASTACWPEDPLSAGPLSGLTAAAQLARSDRLSGSESDRRVQIILLDQSRHHWPLAEADLPLISWLVSADAAGEAWRFCPNRNDLAIVSTGRQREQLLKHGWPASRLVHVPAFITPKAFEAPLDGTREGILLLADLPPEDPDAAGVTLYSHKVLWQALRERLVRQADSWTPAEAQRWLLAAQSVTGIDLGDPAVQEEFQGSVRDILAPAVLLSRTARAILDAGLPLRIAGRGWGRLDWAAPIHDGPADDPLHRLELLTRAKVALVGHCRPGPAWVALEAAAAGAAIMTRAMWPDSDAAQLFEPNRQMLLWRTRKELIERLRGLRRNEPSRMQLVRQARQRAIEEHSADVRLREVLLALRSESRGW